MNAPELLMPAGSLQKLKYAYTFGADAVYLGVPLFSLRARENEFGLEDLIEARRISNELGKKIYLTANIFSKNRKLSSFAEQLSQWVEVGPDAFIMSDPGLMMMAREKYPDLNIHLSVQANCMNWQAVKFWHEKLGVTRIILSRELHIDEIREIKDRVPTVELEAFVHGSICIAYSGRCLMSSYMTYRDANQGVCDNSCREKYKVYGSKVDPEKEDLFIEDLRNPGALYQLSEDENGSYLMNAKDLCLIAHLKEIWKAGVTSFKAEGRTKSLNYVSLVSRAYRKAIDDMVEDRPFDEGLLKDLQLVANRGYDTGFMFRKRPGAESLNLKPLATHMSRLGFLGFMVEDSSCPEGYVPVEVRNQVRVGQGIKLIYPRAESDEFVVESILTQSQRSVDQIHGGTGIFYLKILGRPKEPWAILSGRTDQIRPAAKSKESKSSIDATIP